MLDEKVAVVTGASRGIGKAIALELAAKGARVIVNYNGSKEAAETVVQEIQDAGGNAECYQCDVADFKACEKFIGDLIQKYKKIDILVNNAGIVRDNLMMKMSEQEFDAVLNTNLKGSFHTMRFVSRQMLKQRQGRIVNMASVVGVVGNAGQVNYAASKAGVIAMTKSAAKELASRGVTVNAVAPGLIQTDMTEKLSDSAKEKMMEQIPLARLGRTEDIAKTVAFLVSDDAGYITGQVIHVDGGMVM
ncbi:MAG: 3-oxoacyl-[acyl-carrier-protein] reductase [Lachnospiraceae bacterium]|jgi:3-oxoacyl-[acyl-carrier protein] reductase|nr:3-oxoacyl-[acyl-carrier-protein] reductase [Lachnospiraceae bacterium]